MHEVLLIGVKLDKFKNITMTIVPDQQIHNRTKI